MWEDTLCNMYLGGGGYPPHHPASASQSSHLRSFSSHLYLTFYDLQIFKLSIFTSSVFGFKIMFWDHEIW